MALSNCLAKIIKKEGSPRHSFCGPYKIDVRHQRNLVLLNGAEELGALSFHQFQSPEHSASTVLVQATLSEYIF